MDWTNGVSADGRELAQFIRRRLEVLGVSNITEFSPSLARALSRWEQSGSLVSFWDVDRWTTLLGLHPRDVPEHAWSSARRRELPSDWSVKPEAMHTEPMDSFIGLKLSTTARELLIEHAHAAGDVGISAAARDLIISGMASAGASDDVARRAAALAAQD